MELATIAAQYYEAFLAKYGDALLPSHSKALQAICRCRTPASGEVYVRCPECDRAEWRPLSCGNRNCPKCQNHQASRWIDKQQEKLLPVPYYMATFTLPYELRTLAWFNQKTVYTLLFQCVSSTLKDFGLNPKNLGADIGITMVLHTNSRKLDYHPHIHAVIPGGGIDKYRRQWKKCQGEIPVQCIRSGQGLSCPLSRRIRRGRFFSPLYEINKMGCGLPLCRQGCVHIEILIPVSLPWCSG